MAKLPLAERLRRCCTALMMLVGVLATVATSRAADSIDRSVVGRTIVLSAEHPRETALISASANAQALEGADGGAVTFRHDEIWEPSPPLSTVDFEVVKTSGTPLDEESSSMACFGTDACMGSYRVTFTWPGEVSRGSVRISWGARVHLETGITPDGARASISVDPPTTASGIRRAITYRRDISVEPGPAALGAFSIVADRPAPDARPRMELIGVLSGSAQDVHFEMIDAQGLERVTPGHPVPIEWPERCSLGPCSVPVRYQAWIDQSVTRGTRITVSLTSSASGPPLDFRHLPEPAAAFVIAVGRLPRLQPSASRSTVRGVVHIPAQALTPATSTARGVRLRGNVEIEQPAISYPYARVRTKVTFPETPGVGAKEVRKASDMRAGRGVAFRIPNTCQTGIACAIPFVITITASYRYDDTRPMQPILAVALGYPRTGRVPAPAKISLTVEGNR